MELLAAVLAIKLDFLVRRELNVTILEFHFWTDSQIILAYIQSNSKRFKLFVANRVSLIREHSTPEQWKYIKGEENPADILSRGCTVQAISKKWFYGPKFISDYKHAWPAISKTETNSLEKDPKIIRDQKKFNEPLVVNATDIGHSHPLEFLIEHFSSYYRLKKAICWLVRIKNHLLKRPSTQMTNSVTVPEMKQAEVLVVKFVQLHAFPQEIHSIRNEAAVSKSSPISKLSPILQEDMLVVGGRLSYSSIAYAAKHPIILPHKNKVSQMIVEECHNAAHLGTEWMLSQIRNKFWIIKARKLIKKVKYKCVTCKKLYGLPATQKMADYPSERCEPGKPPFTYVGVDLFGPFYVKVGRSEVSDMVAYLHASTQEPSI